jgi:hypothetical protein
MGRVEAAGWLVGDQERGFLGKCAGNQDAGALAAGKFGRAAFGKGSGAGVTQGGFDGVVIMGAGGGECGAVGQASERDDGPDVQGPCDLALLGDIGRAAGAFGRAEGAERVAANADVAGDAGCGLIGEEAEGRLEERGLAGAVGAEDRDDLAGRNA